MDLQSIVDNEVQLPPTPQILPKLQAVLKNDACSVFDIVSIVKMDASLTAKVVQVSNSAFYGAAEPCKHLEEAVNRIGVDETYRVVSMSAASQVFGADLPVYGMGRGELLEQSLVAAVLMTEVALRKPWLDGESAYTVGLLHGLGKVIVNQHFVNQGLDDYDPATQGPLDYQREHAIIGFDSSQAGASVLANWKFPEDIYQPIAYQYNPLAAPVAKPMACLLTMAISAIYVVQQEEREGQISFQGNESIMEEIPIDHDELVDCIACAREAFRDVRELLSNF